MDGTVTNNDGKTMDSAGEAEEDLRCGYGPWRPDCIQKANSTKFLLAAVCFFAAVQGWVVMGITNINTATLERRFDMRSTQVAWITSGYDISAGVLGIALGYLSGFIHKGKMMTVGAAVMSCGSFVMFLPHLFVGNYDLQSTGRVECDIYGNYTDASCASGSSLSNYLYVFIAGQVLHGFGGVSVYNIGLTYIDDNLRSKDLPLFVGILHCFAALGPAIAFLAGGAFLNIHVDIGRVDLDDVTLTPSDPGWVGAWWIGYIIAFIAAALVSFTVACFPRQLPETRLIQSERVSEAYKGSGEKEMDRADFGRSWSDVTLALKIVLTNPTWIFVTIGATVENAAVTAFATFLPKILQFQFNLSPAAAALFTGVLAVPGAAGGQLLGGLIPRWLRSRLRGLLIQMAIYSGIALVLAPVFLIRCDMPDIAGVNVHYLNTSLGMDEEAVLNPCNAKCSCTTLSYEPLCGHDNILYFSPCHAGCTNHTELREGDVVYSECSCMPGLNVTAPAQGEWMGRAGVCDAKSCDWQLPVFLILFLVVMLVTFMVNTLGHAATIRCVPDKQRGFAFGIQGAITRVFGSIPAPLLIGLVFDSSCLIWQERCEQNGACWIYDSQSMAFKLTLVVVVIKSISCVSFFLAYLFYSPPNEPDIIKSVIEGKDNEVFDNQSIDAKPTAVEKNKNVNAFENTNVTSCPDDIPTTKL